MTKLLTVLLVALLFEAVGVVFLGIGLKQIGEIDKISVAGVLHLVKRGITNPNILLGVAFEATFFGALLYLLSQSDVSLIWPLTSLGFVLTALAARFVKHEEVSGLRWCGVGLIVCGAMLVGWSEAQKQRAEAQRSAAEKASAGLQSQ